MPPTRLLTSASGSRVRGTVAPTSAPWEPRSRLCAQRLAEPHRPAPRTALLRRLAVLLWRAECRCHHPVTALLNQQHLDCTAQGRGLQAGFTPQALGVGVGSFLFV